MGVNANLIPLGARVVHLKNFLLLIILIAFSPATFSQELSPPFTIGERLLFIRREPNKSPGFSRYVHLFSSEPSSARPRLIRSEDGVSYNKMENFSRYAGRVARVTAIHLEDSSDTEWQMSLLMENDGTAVRVRSEGGTMTGLLRASIIDSARTKFAGRTLWYAGTHLASEAPGSGQATVKKYSPFAVVDVTVSWDITKPIRLIATTRSGLKTYFDLGLEADLGEDLLSEDPRNKYKWPRRIWAAIESEIVLIGMTKEQALMSWGSPNDINRTITRAGTFEQWVYGGGNYLYLKNGVVTAIQN